MSLTVFSYSRKSLHSSRHRYFINDSDQIRMISDPSAEFKYKINRNERWNEANKEAMNGVTPS